MNSKIKLITIASFLVFIMPLIGIPRNFKNILLFIFGAVIFLSILSLKKNIKTLKLKLKRLEGQQGSLIG